MFKKKLPVIPLEVRESRIHSELLSIVYHESSIVPFSFHIEEDEGRDYLTQKYVDKVETLMLNIKGEVIFPAIPLFDCKMFALDYRKFYS